MSKAILIIDDDIDLCTLLSRFLKKHGFETVEAHTGSRGIAKFKDGDFDMVISDYRLGDMDGSDMMVELKKINPSVRVLIITGYSDIKIAVDLIKKGAYDYIVKPLIPDEVLNIINNAMKNPPSYPNNSTQAVESEGSSKTTSKNISAAETGEFMIGKAPTTKALYDQIDIVAKTNYSIILYGESGTGKEVVAKTIHDRSSRSGQPFIALDCGTLSKELAGSELFGHVKGAFTGALQDKEGHFQLADGGTLFLDEVGNLSLDVQAALLRVIQERKYKKVGGNKEKSVDVRIIVASNENLQEAYKKGRFREDLYHRFNEFSINLPPLRFRREDILSFAAFFLAKTNRELEKEVTGFDKEVQQAFQQYEWPGNLREFRNVVRRAVLLTPSGEEVKVSTLPWEITQAKSSPLQAMNAAPETSVVEEKKADTTSKEPDLKSAAGRAEYETIMEVLKQVNFNKKKAAELLKIDRKTLYNKIKNFQE